MAGEHKAHITLSNICIEGENGRKRELIGNFTLETYLDGSHWKRKLGSTELPGDGVALAAIDSLFDDLEDLMEESLKEVVVDVIPQVPVRHHA